MRVYENKVAADETTLPKISASRLKRFLLCPRQFYYHYIEEREEKKNIFAVLGTAVHRAIAAFFLEKRQPQSVFFEEWTTMIRDYNLYDDKNLYRRGLDILDRYPHYDAPPIEVEREYALPYPPEDPICMLTVVFDQVYDWGVRDLKTNKNPPPQFELNNDLQFILYADAFSILFNKPPERVVWHQLESGKDIEARVIGKREIAVDAIRGLLRNGYFYRKIGAHCTYCSFKEECLDV